MTNTVCGAQYKLVRFSAFPLRLDVQANTSHPQNAEVDGTVPTLAGWGGKQLPVEVVWRMRRLSIPQNSTAASTGSLVIRMFGTSEDWE